LQSNKAPITYDPCMAINFQTQENGDYYPELTGLKGANNLYLILKPFDNDSWPLVLLSRETRGQIDLPKEIAEGKLVVMTQRAIYVLNENKLMCYDLCSKKTHIFLNAQLPEQAARIRISEFEDKIIVDHYTQLHLYNSEYKETWNKTFHSPIVTITPMTEFLAVLEWNRVITFLDWDYGECLNDKTIDRVVDFADYYFVRHKLISTTSHQFDIDKY
jgi:hypothetical protein